MSSVKRVFYTNILIFLGALYMFCVVFVSVYKWECACVCLCLHLCGFNCPCMYKMCIFISVYYENKWIHLVATFSFGNITFAHKSLYYILLFCDKKYKKIYKANLCLISMENYHTAEEGNLTKTCFVTDSLL